MGSKKRVEEPAVVNIFRFTTILTMFEGQDLLHFARICHLPHFLYENRDTGSLDKSAQTGVNQSILKGFLK